MSRERTPPPPLTSARGWRCEWACGSVRVPSLHAGKPLVVHNGVLDLAAVLARLWGGPLPDCHLAFNQAARA